MHSSARLFMMERQLVQYISSAPGRLPCNVAAPHAVDLRQFIEVGVPNASTHPLLRGVKEDFHLARISIVSKVNKRQSWA